MLYLGVSEDNSSLLIKLFDFADLTRCFTLGCLRTNLHSLTYWELSPGSKCNSFWHHKRDRKQMFISHLENKRSCTFHTSHIPVSVLMCFYDIIYFHITVGGWSFCYLIFVAPAKQNATKGSLFPLFVCPLVCSSITLFLVQCATCVQN